MSSLTTIWGLTELTKKIVEERTTSVQMENAKENVRSLCSTHSPCVWKARRNTARSLSRSVGLLYKVQHNATNSSPKELIEFVVSLLTSVAHRALQCADVCVCVWVAVNGLYASLLVCVCWCSNCKNIDMFVFLLSYNSVWRCRRKVSKLNAKW